MQFGPKLQPQVPGAQDRCRRGEGGDRSKSALSPQAPTSASLSHGSDPLGIPGHPAANPLSGKRRRPLKARRGWTRGTVLTGTPTRPRKRRHPAAGTARAPGRRLWSPPQCPHPSLERST